MLRFALHDSAAEEVLRRPHPNTACCHSERNEDTHQQNCCHSERSEESLNKTVVIPNAVRNPPYKLMPVGCSGQTTRPNAITPLGMLRFALHDSVAEEVLRRPLPYLLSFRTQ